MNKEKQFQQLPLITRIRLYALANYENRQEVKVKYFQLTFGTVVTKTFKRKWYNPMRFLLGSSGRKIIDPRTLTFDASDIKIKSTHHER